MTADPVADLYERLGAGTLTAIVAGFYRRIPGDDVLGPMYPADDLDGAEARLREFLVQRLGGPSDYSDRRGHPRLRMRHARFRIDAAARDRWMELMTAAVRDVDVDESDAQRLLAFLGDVATFLRNAE